MKSGKRSGTTCLADTPRSGTEALTVTYSLPGSHVHSLSVLSSDGYLLTPDLPPVVSLAWFSLEVGLHHIFLQLSS